VRGYIRGGADHQGRIIAQVSEGGVTAGAEKGPNLTGLVIVIYGQAAVFLGVPTQRTPAGLHRKHTFVILGCDTVAKSIPGASPRLGDRRHRNSQQKKGEVVEFSWSNRAEYTQYQVKDLVDMIETKLGERLPDTIRDRVIEEAETMLRNSILDIRSAVLANEKARGLS
jgi:hypothetical protein